MIKPQGDAKLSIRSIKLDGGTDLEGQQRGSNVLTIEYWTIIRMYDPEIGKNKDVAISKNELVLNGQFRDEEFNEAITYFKKLAVKTIKETNDDQKTCIDAAIDTINKGK